MDNPTIIKTDESLVIPERLLSHLVNTKTFVVKSVEGALIIEPADKADETSYTLTAAEESKLKQSLSEDSLPVTSLGK